MKKKLVICIVLIFTTTLVAHKKQEVKMALGDIVLQNIEALAQYESGDCQEWTTKNCYEVFTTDFGPDYYATCSSTTMGGVAECGSIVSSKPAGMSNINTCLQCIR